MGENEFPSRITILASMIRKLEVFLEHFISSFSFLRWQELFEATRTQMSYPRN